MKQALKHFSVLALSVLLLLPTACIYKDDQQPVDQQLTTNVALKPDTALMDTSTEGKHFKPQHQPGLQDDARAKKIEQEAAPLCEKIKNILAGDDDLEVEVFKKIIVDTLFNKDLSKDAKQLALQEAVSCIHSLEDNYKKQTAMNSLRDAIKHNGLPAESVKSLNFLVLWHEIACHIQKHQKIGLMKLVLKIHDCSLPNGEAIEFLGQMLAILNRKNLLKKEQLGVEDKSFISWWLQANSSGEYSSDLIKCLQQPVLMNQMSTFEELLSDKQKTSNVVDNAFNDIGIQASELGPNGRPEPAKELETKSIKSISTIR